MERFRPRLVRRGEITEAGRRGHELARLDYVLRQNKNPHALMALAPHIEAQYSERRQELVGQLGISQNSKIQEKRIKQIGEELLREGYPTWRMLSAGRVETVPMVSDTAQDGS